MSQEFLYVVEGTDTQLRNQDIINLIQSWNMPTPKMSSFAESDLAEGRAKALTFYNSLESNYTSRGNEKKRSETSIVIINFADKFAELMPSHYSMMLLSLLTTINYNNLGIRVILAVPSAEGKTPIQVAKSLLCK